MANEPINSHDAFFKQYLSIPHAAVDFLRNHLPAAVLAQLDLTQLQLEKDTFVDEQLRNHFSDLVYRTTTAAETPPPRRRWRLRCSLSTRAIRMNG